MERKHGSASADEMAARMKDAGYEDWEIAEELDLKAWAEKTVARNGKLLNETGRIGYVNPDRSDSRSDKKQEGADAPREEGRDMQAAKPATETGGETR